MVRKGAFHYAKPNRPVRDQWEYPRKMERHFPIKPGHPIRNGSYYKFVNSALDNLLVSGSEIFINFSIKTGVGKLPQSLFLVEVGPTKAADKGGALVV